MGGATLQVACTILCTAYVICVCVARSDTKHCMQAWPVQKAFHASLASLRMGVHCMPYSRKTLGFVCIRYPQSRLLAVLYCDWSPAARLRVCMQSMPSTWQVCNKSASSPCTDVSPSPQSFLLCNTLRKDSTVQSRAVTPGKV